MMNWLHLLWILPVTFSLGFMCAAILSAASRADGQAERLEDIERAVRALAGKVADKWAKEHVEEIEIGGTL